MRDTVMFHQDVQTPRRELLLTVLVYELKIIKTESARRWSNKWTKTLYQDYLHCIPNFCRAVLIIFSKQFISSNSNRQKRMLNFCLCFHKITEL